MNPPDHNPNDRVPEVQYTSAANQSAPSSGQAQEPGQRRRNLWWMLALPAVIAAAAIGFLATQAIFGEEADEAEVEVIPVWLVSADEPGIDPFTSDLSLVSVEDAAAAADLGRDLGESRTEAGSGGLALTQTTATSGGPIYGEIAEAMCDVDEMADALTSDPAVGEAWADLMGVDQQEIGGTLEALVPLVLTRDTAVTNSRYHDGAGATYQAVLQAGTAVLVDEEGVPRVRCSCTNPLSPPELADHARLEGPEWDGFDSTNVIAVDPLEAGVEQVPVVDLHTGEERDLKLNSSRTVEIDGLLVDDATGVYVVDEDGERLVDILDHPVAAVFDDGEGGLIYQREREGSEELWRRRDTTTFPPEDADEATIWHLPAGASEPAPLLGSTDPLNHWYSLQDVASTDRGTLIAYFEMSGPSGCNDRCESFDQDSGYVLNLATGDSTAVDSTAGSISTGFSVSGDAIVYAWMSNDHGFLDRFDLDLQPLDSTCDIDCAAGFRGIASADTWLGITSSHGYSLRACPFMGSAACDEFELSHDTPENSWGVTVAVEGNRAIVSVPTPDRTSFTTYDVDLAGDNETVSVLPIGGRTRVLSAPIVRPEGASPPVAAEDPEPEPPAPPPPPARASASWDEIKDADIPAMCIHPASKLVDGVDLNVPENMGYFELRQLLHEGAPGVIEGIESPDGPITAVAASCNAGGVSWPDPIVFFDSAGRYYGSTFLTGPSAEDDQASEAWYDAWVSAGLVGPARNGVISMHADGDVLVVQVGAMVDGDAACCASGAAEVRVRPLSTGVELVDLVRTG